MKSTYLAMQVSRPGTLELVERPISSPGHGEVLIAVDAWEYAAQMSMISKAPISIRNRRAFPAMR